MASVILSLALLAGGAAAQSTITSATSAAATTTEAAGSSTVNWPATPLISLEYPRPSDAPYQVFPYDGHDIFTRGYQSGYNICNSTTEGDASLCQTLVMNGIDGAWFSLFRKTRISYNVRAHRLLSLGSPNPQRYRGCGGRGRCLLH